MPFAKIHVIEGRYDEARIAKVSGAIQAAPMNALHVPAEDFYQLVFEFPKNHFLHTPSFVGMHYTDDLIILDLTFTPTSLIEDGVDIALHGGELSDSNLIDKKLIETPSRTSARGLTEDELPTVGLRCPPLLACSLTRHLPTRIMTCS